MSWPHFPRPVLPRPPAAAGAHWHTRRGGCGRSVHPRNVQGHDPPRCARGKRSEAVYGVTRAILPAPRAAGSDVGHPRDERYKIGEPFGGCGNRAQGSRTGNPPQARPSLCKLAEPVEMVTFRTRPSQLNHADHANAVRVDRSKKNSARANGLTSPLHPQIRWIDRGDRRCGQVILVACQIGSHGKRQNLLRRPAGAR
jgi:hypothetical protein